MLGFKELASNQELGNQMHFNISFFPTNPIDALLASCDLNSLYNILQEVTKEPRHRDIEIAPITSQQPMLKDRFIAPTVLHVFVGKTSSWHLIHLSIFLEFLWGRFVVYFPGSWMFLADFNVIFSNQASAFSSCSKLSPLSKTILAVLSINIFQGDGEFEHLTSLQPTKTSTKQRPWKR